MHSTEDVNERKLKGFVLRRFERHFQFPAGNSGYPKSAYLAVLVLTAMAHRFVDGGKHRNGTSWFYRLATLCVVEKGRRFEIAAIGRNWQILDLHLQFSMACVSIVPNLQSVTSECTGSIQIYSKTCTRPLVFRPLPRQSQRSNCYHLRAEALAL